MIKFEWKTCARACVVLTLSTVAVAAQTPTYRTVNLGDVILGYVKPPERIETAGDLRWSDGRLLLNVSPMSAMVSLVVDATALPAADVRVIQTRCQAFRGRPGCWVKVRGEVAVLREALVAHAIEVETSPEVR